MSPEYDKEVDDFLQNVNSLTEDDILARVNSETSEEDVDGKVLDEITEVVGIVVDAATAKKKPSNRYRWKVQEAVKEQMECTGTYLLWFCCQPGGCKYMKYNYHQAKIHRKLIKV